MKLAVITAMLLAAFAATDFASARQGKQVSISKGSVTVPKTTAPKTSEPVSKGPTTNGFIMSDGRICNPRWGC